ncbi:hypothetical protein NRB56_28540 [Nocardia sp. RB56]|uniref:HTH luxR-type domain-containing protein n=1 Tax=Nocardia aurantia TaxID=2585199 RepID=A0A7K0DNK4_9NOCA|nr:hypothetical protein [Nocardia aurantia]
MPARRAALDQLLARTARPGRSSAIVVVTAPAGGGLTTFMRAVADHCGIDRDVRAATVYRLLGLPWETAAGDGLAGIVVPEPQSPAKTAERWRAALAQSAADSWDAVILLEDAHYVDSFTLQTLVSMGRRPDPPRVLVLLGWRDTDPYDPGAQQPSDRLRDVVRAAADHIVHLTAIGTADVGALADGRGLGFSPAQIDRLLRHSGGRIRNVVELLDEVSPADWDAPYFSLPAPATAARAVSALLDGLDKPATDLVHSVAVLEAADRQAPVVAVESAGRVGRVGDTVRAVAVAARAGLLITLDEHATVVRLPDPVVRRAVLAHAGPVRCAELHTRAAETTLDAAVALRHRWFASPRPDAELANGLDELAADRARQGAWAAAGDLLMLAAHASTEHESRAGRLMRAVDALVGAGEVPRASRYLTVLESLHETPLRNAVLGYLAVVRGRPAEAESRLARAWKLVDPSRDAPTASLIAQRYVLHHLVRCRPRDLVLWSDRAIELVDPDTPTAVEAAAIRGLGIAPLRGIDVALEGYGALVERVPEGPVAQRVTMASGWLHLAGDDLDRAREELQSAVPIDFLGGSVRISLWARAWLARVQFQSGDWQEALRTATAGVELAQRSGMSLLVPLLEWTRTQIHALRGDWDAAERCLRSGDAGAREYEMMRVPAALARAALSEARADYPAVLRALAPLTEPWAREWVDKPGYWPWADVYANALVATGRQDDADAFLRPHEQAAAAFDHGSATARLAYARGRWHGHRGDIDAARACFVRAIALLEPLPLRYDRARVHFAFGQALRRAGRRAEADAVISTARDAYVALGADTYVARCDRELAAGGVNAVRMQRGFDDLTPQEEAVAALVAVGRSNKEVAAELFLSVKTVQYHLTRIYAKLGIRSRAELAARRAAANPE